MLLKEGFTEETEVELLGNDLCGLNDCYSSRFFRGLAEDGQRRSRRKYTA